MKIWNNTQFGVRDWNVGYIEIKESKKLMDQQLADCIRRLNLQNDLLGLVRAQYLEAESTRKHYEAKMISGAEGKSHAERLVNAQASEEWRELSLSIAKFESELEFNKLKMSVLDKEYLALHLSLKIDSEVMRKS